MMYPAHVTIDLLYSLIEQWECETIEFKSTQPGGHDISQYVSALANEAFLKGHECGWYVLGVSDKSREVVGTGYKSKDGELSALLRDIMVKTGRDADVHCSTLDVGGKRVLMFWIAAAKPGHPVYSNGHAWGRKGDSLCALSKDDEDRIRFSSQHHDWSVLPVAGAGADDLDTAALQKAREIFAEHHPHLSAEIASWSAMDLVSRLGLTRNGKLTNAALVLLGKPESLSKAGLDMAEIRWILRNHMDDTLDYKHLHIPFLLAANKVYETIRNTTYRYMSHEGIFPKEIERYDAYTLREAINNAVAHADYMSNECINVVEYENDRVVVSNAGSFLPGSVKEVLSSSAPFSKYRNACLAEAMVKLHMIDKVGSGIRTMFKHQIARLFPVPEYKLDHSHVQVVIQGKILDYAFAFNMYSKGLSPLEISLLYDVYSGRRIEKEGVAILREKHLVAGRFPNVKVARFLGEYAPDADVRKNIIESQDMSPGTYIAHIRDIMEDGHSRKRSEILHMLERHLPVGYDKQAMERKISRLLKKMLVDGLLVTNGNGKAATWRKTVE